LLFDNVILVDADGCFLYWEHSFDMWMIMNGYKLNTIGEYDIEHRYHGITAEQGVFLAKMFNESAALGKLPPYKDAIKYIRKLHEEHGYVFHCISAVPNDPHVYDMRMQNIENLFGKTAFERVILCGESENKKKHLEFYKGSGCFWIEDVPKNAEYGLLYGLEPILVEHHYNRDYENPYMLKKVKNWKEIYAIVTGERD